MTQKLALHKGLYFALIGVCGVQSSHAGGVGGGGLDPQPLPVAKGVYRLPYADRTDVRFTNDYTNHPASLNRIDMIGIGPGSGPFTVVSAAAGWIRLIVENNDTKCPDSCGPNNDCDGNGTRDDGQAQTNACGGYSGPSSFCCERDIEDTTGVTCPSGGTCRNTPNNFVWIEHANGEWTKYTHMLRGTVGQGTDNNGNPGAQRFVGEFVNAGTILGIEGDVGFASGVHVHFEVGVPNYVELLDELLVLNATEDDPDYPPDDENDWFGGGFLVDDGIQDDVLFEDPDNDGMNNPDDDVNRQNRIFAFCQVGFPPADNDENTAGPCNDVCDTPVTDLSGVTYLAGTPYYNQVPNTTGNPNGNFIIEANSGGSIRAANSITLSPGFHAELGSYFTASIGGCDTPGGVGE